jgi:hypothetical protein
MKTQYHILNGDSLKQQFPETIQGEIIVTHECLVDGNVRGNSLDELFQVRAQFISNNYENRLLLTELDKFTDLWKLYQKNGLEQLLKTAKELESKYPFILTVVKAHTDRIPTKGNLGRPSQSLIQIMKELETDEFEPVFKEFSKRESIYGFGDLQVKRLFDEVKNNR